MKRTYWILPLILALAACAKPKVDNLARERHIRTYGFNHRHEWVTDFVINGTWGANVPPIDSGGGGGSSTASPLLPVVFRPGMKVKIAELRDDENKKTFWKRQEVYVEPYLASEIMTVHFYDNEEVRVVGAISFPADFRHPVSKNDPTPRPMFQPRDHYPNAEGDDAPLP